MKIFLGLFLFGWLAYVQASHKCDPRAADMNPNGMHGNNYHIPFEQFIENSKGSPRGYIPYATINNNFGSDDNFKFCTSISFADPCGVIFFNSKITNENKDGNFRKTFHSYSFNKKNNKLTAYSMEFKLSDPEYDDYIFKSTGVITAYHEDGPVTPIDIPSTMKPFLNKELAIYYADKKFAVHVLCEEDYAWVSLSDGVVLDVALKTKIKEVVDKLALVENIPFKKQDNMRYVEDTTYDGDEWIKKFPKLVMPVA